MEDSFVKFKCVGYLAFLSALLLTATLSYNFSARLHSSDRITIDVLQVCKSLQGEMCTRFTDTESCLEAANDRQSCIATVTLWQDQFNAKCEWEIADYLACKSQSTCEATMKTLQACEEAISRPEWFLLPQLPQPVWLKESTSAQP